MKASLVMIYAYVLRNTFSLSTLPWKNRKSAASENSPLDASINLWAASAPDLTLEPSRPKNGLTIVWNHNKANLQTEEKLSIDCSTFELRYF